MPSDYKKIHWFVRDSEEDIEPDTKPDYITEALVMSGNNGIATLEFPASRNKYVYFFVIDTSRNRHDPGDGYAQLCGYVATPTAPSVPAVSYGNGNHKFVKGIKNVYHDFEPIKKEIKWKYKKSMLNLYNTSESNILSVANNQRILHDFLFGKDTEFDDIDISKRPKTYFPHRTKTSFSYNIGKNITIELEKIQIEIDLTIEYSGTVGIFEAKNGKLDSFAVYQIYHPFLYYHKAKKDIDINKKLKKIICVYLVRTVKEDINYLNLWAYTFSNPYDISTIKLLKSATYKLIKQN